MITLKKPEAIRQQYIGNVSFYSSFLVIYFRNIFNNLLRDQEKCQLVIKLKLHKNNEIESQSINKYFDSKIL